MKDLKDLERGIDYLARVDIQSKMNISKQALYKKIELLRNLDIEITPLYLDKGITVYRTPHYERIMNYSTHFDRAYNKYGKILTPLNKEYVDGVDYFTEKHIIATSRHSTAFKLRQRIKHLESLGLKINMLFSEKLEIYFLKKDYELILNYRKERVSK